MKFKKILYISQMDASESAKANDGVTKKIFWQMKAFEELEYKVDYTCKIDGFYYYIKDGQQIKLFKESKYSFVDASKICNKLIKLIKEKKIEFYDYVYIRSMKVDLNFVKLAKIMKLNKYKIIIEYPTYPYKGELGKSVKRWLGYYLDKYYSSKLHRYIYGTVNFHGYKTIHNIESVSIENGIDVNSIIKKISNNKNEKIIDIIAVAKMSKWHGYERIIVGLGEYYRSISQKQYQVNLHLVGQGPEIDMYKSLVKKYRLNNNVLFYGNKGGEELDKIFNLCDIAVGSLGLYKIGVDKECTLKGKEYCARGIPYIISQSKCEDDFKYRYTISNDDSIVNIDEIIDYYNLIKNDKNKEDVMRKYAEENYSWNKQIKTIIEHYETKGI